MNCTKVCAQASLFCAGMLAAAVVMAMVSETTRVVVVFGIVLASYISYLCVQVSRMIERSK